MPSYCNRLANLIVVMAALILVCEQTSGQGIVLPGVGPVNRAMSGAATAAPLDAAGAIQWNPATIAELPGNEMMFGVEAVYSQTRLTSTVQANSFGPGAPPVTLSDSSDSNSGISALPQFALVWRPENSDWTYGFGAMTIGGFGVNYAGSNSNPILTARPPAGVGFGPLYSRLGILQIAPTIAKQITPKLSFGFSPTFVAADLQLDPYFLGAPDDANGDGFATYPTAINNRLRWGLGFQTGLYYKTDSGINLGVSYKSKQWFETFEFNSADELGRPRTLRAETDYPAIISIGASYMPNPRLLLASDLRYIDYDNARVFGDSAGFNPDGSATGLGWQSVFSLSTGMSYQWSNRLAIRAGYFYGTSPISNAVTSANIQSSALYNHGISLGSTVNMTNCLLFSWAWVHSFDKTNSSQLATPFGPLPGSEVRIRQRNDSIVAGFTVKF
jgi:long-chain fatty acid transport protein